MILGFVVIAVSWSATTANAEILCDFENGSADYDNTHGTQTTGKFRDVYDFYAAPSPTPSSFIDISANETANDYLVMGPIYTSSYNPTTMYDLTPSSTAEYTMFKTPVGATTTMTVDVKFDLGAGTNVAGLVIFDPLASTATPRGLAFQFLDYAPGSDDKVRIMQLGTEKSWGTPNTLMAATAVGQLNAPIVRLTAEFNTLSDSTGTVKYRVDQISDLGGSVTGNLWNGDPISLTFGAGTGQLNMYPVSDGFEVGLNRNVSNNGGANKPWPAGEEQIYFDNLTLTVPEPGTLALLACGLVGLLAYAWRKRK